MLQRDMRIRIRSNVWDYGVKRELSTVLERFGRAIVFLAKKKGSHGLWLPCIFYRMLLMRNGIPAPTPSSIPLLQATVQIDITS